MAKSQDRRVGKPDERYQLHQLLAELPQRLRREQVLESSERIQLAPLGRGSSKREQASCLSYSSCEADNREGSDYGQDKGCGIVETADQHAKSPGGSRVGDHVRRLSEEADESSICGLEKRWDDHRPDQRYEPSRDVR